MCASAPTIEEAFADAALGVLAMAVDPASVEELDTRVVRAHGSDARDLLVNWLGECLYILDVEGFAARRVEMLAAALNPGASGGEPLRLHCLLHGEEIDPRRHAAAHLSCVDRDSAFVKASDGMTKIRIQIRC